MSLIDLDFFGCAIHVECMDRVAEALLNEIYCSFKRPAKNAQITYRISRDKLSGKLWITRDGESPEIARDGSDFIYLFEKNITIETEKLRRDLYFVHAAVLDMDGYAVALIAPSGHGKSTTTWGLLHHEFKYLSDELAPIDLTTMRVHSFPHALCLKAIPSDAYPLPAKTIYAGRTVHVPTSCFPCETTVETLPLKTVFFLRFIGEGAAPVLKPISKVDATIRLFTNALNPIAHPADGLDAAAEIVSKTQCFELLSADLRATCELVKTVFPPDFAKVTATPVDVLPL